MTRLEHANICVKDIDEALTFLKAIDPNVRILADKTPDTGTRWVHVALGDDYLAVEGPHDPTKPSALHNRYQNFGINHLGLVVDDLAAAKARLEEAGYAETHIPELHPARHRRYFLDGSGLEWELVQYLSDDPSERFSYD